MAARWFVESEYELWRLRKNLVHGEDGSTMMCGKWMWIVEAARGTTEIYQGGGVGGKKICGYILVVKILRVNIF